MNNKRFVIGAAILPAIVLGAFMLLSKPSPPTAPSVSTIDVSQRFIRNHSPSFGTSLARVTVTEWFDPQCESCRMFHPTVKKLMNEYNEKIHFVFRYMPFHPGSDYVSAILQEANAHGKFEEALGIIFERQPEWGNHESPNPGLVPSYLKGLGIPLTNFEQEYLRKKYGAQIKTDQEDGELVGVTGTPTFFVNGVMVPEFGEAPLRAAIQNAFNSAL